MSDTPQVVVFDNSVQLIAREFERGPPGPPGTTRIDTLVVPPSTPTVVDKVDISAQAVKWIVTVKDGSARGVKEVLALLNGGTADFSGAYNLRDVAFTVDVNVNAGNFELEVEHSASGNADIMVLRIAVE